jgi:hypothetical protein
MDAKRKTEKEEMNANNKKNWQKYWKRQTPIEKPADKI